MAERSSRGQVRIITAEEAQARADHLFASVEMLPVGNARTAVLKEAASFRALAEIKRVLASPTAENSASGRRATE